MNCPYCQAPVSKISLLTQIGGARPCESCKREFMVRYNWPVVGLVVLGGFVITTLGLTLFTPGQPSGEVILLAAGAILTIAAVIGARAEKLPG